MNLLKQGMKLLLNKGGVMQMKLSVSIWSLVKKIQSGEMNNLNFISFCHKQDVKYVELLDCFLSEPKDIEDVKECLNKYEMEVSSYSVTNDFVIVNKEDRDKQVKKMLNNIDLACQLNTRFMRVFSGNPKKGVEYEVEKNWIIDGFKQVLPYAEEKGVTLVIENNGLFVGKSIQVKELLETLNSQYLRANTDVANFLLANEKSITAVKNLKDYIGFVHFKDFKEVKEKDRGYEALDGRRYEGTILGKGEVPLEEIVDFLASIGYEGFLSIEYEGTGDPIKETIESINYVRKIIK